MAIHRTFVRKRGVFCHRIAYYIISQPSAFSGHIVIAKSQYIIRKLSALLRGSGSKWISLTNETKNLNFLTFVYIFRLVTSRSRVGSGRARGGSLLRRVKGSALNNPVSHWLSVPETVINLTISVFNEESPYFGRFSRVLPMPESDRCLSHTFTQSSFRVWASSTSFRMRSCRCNFVVVNRYLKS